MSSQNWRDAVQAYIRREARPADKFGHQPRLYALATQIGEGMEYDDEVVFAAAWMHDLGVFLGHRPQEPEALAHWDHVPYTIEQSRVLLSQCGFPLGKLDAVAEAIRTHQAETEPVTLEATLLHDADILEQLGAVGAMRAIAKVGRDTRFEDFSSVVAGLQKALDHLPAKIRLERAMTLALPKLEILQALLAAVEREAGNQLY